MNDKDKIYNNILQILSVFPLDSKKLEKFKKVLAELLNL